MSFNVSGWVGIFTATRGIFQHILEQTLHVHNLK